MVRPAWTVRSIEGGFGVSPFLRILGGLEAVRLVREYTVGCCKLGTSGYPCWLPLATRIGYPYWLPVDRAHLDTRTPL